MKYAKTYERPYQKLGVLGLETTVRFSGGKREVSYDFLKEGKKKALELQNKTIKGGK
jgi:hypothetical protein